MPRSRGSPRKDLFQFSANLGSSASSAIGPSSEFDEFIGKQVGSNGYRDEASFSLKTRAAFPGNP